MTRVGNIQASKAMATPIISTVILSTFAARTTRTAMAGTVRSASAMIRMTVSVGAADEPRDQPQQQPDADPDEPRDQPDLERVRGAEDELRPQVATLGVRAEEVRPRSAPAGGSSRRRRPPSDRRAAGPTIANARSAAEHHQPDDELAA